MEQEELQRELLNKWNLKKQDLNFSKRTEVIYFKEGDIWWCSLGMNIGSESYGKGEDFRRPVLVFKKLSSDLFVGLPLTSKVKIGTWFANIRFQSKERTVLLYQIKSFNKKRLWIKIGEMDGGDFKIVRKKLELLLELSL